MLDFHVSIHALEHGIHTISPGRLCIGAIAAMMVSAPFVRPDEPSPAIALPTINMVEDRATPQIMEPNSKRPRKAMKVVWGKLAKQLQTRDRAYLGGEVGIYLSG
jgi:hypothetical protein